jgi:iron complex outermembrane receptor protein
VSATIGVDYKQPVGDRLIGHVFLNDVFRSRANLSTTLSEYTWQGAYNVTNGGLGFASQDDRIEVDFIAKNLLNTRYAVNLGQYSNSAGVAEFYGDPRYVGINVRARF